MEFRTPSSSVRHRRTTFLLAVCLSHRCCKPKIRPIQVVRLAHSTACNCSPCVTAKCAIAKLFAQRSTSSLSRTATLRLCRPQQSLARGKRGCTETASSAKVFRSYSILYHCCSCPSRLIISREGNLKQDQQDDLPFGLHPPPLLRRKKATCTNFIGHLPVVPCTILTPSIALSAVTASQT